MAAFHALGAKAVATCATISFASTLSLGTFITLLVLRYRGIATSNTPSSTGIRFLRTPTGYIFMNLLVADTTQALGFALTWHWARLGGIQDTSRLCLFQALAIQAGDVASSIFSLYIAIYTARLLTVARRPSDRTLQIACGSAWLFVALFTALGPLAVAKDNKGSFYGQAGNWCWIASPYESYRLYFHYLLIFISCAGQLFSYLAIFIIIRFRLVPQRKKMTDVEHEDKAKPATRRETPSIISRSIFDRTSMLMLLYPLVNLTVVLPLSVYRILGLSGARSTSEGLAACGCIFALGGLANTVLYASSRHLLSIHPKKDDTTFRTASGPSLWPFRTAYSHNAHGTTTLGRRSADMEMESQIITQKDAKEKPRTRNSSVSSVDLNVRCELPSIPNVAFTLAPNRSITAAHLVSLVRPSSRQGACGDVSGVAVNQETVVRFER